MSPLVLGIYTLLGFYCLALLVLMAGFSRLRRQAIAHPDISPDLLPSVSIVVAARNEEQNLPQLVHCLLAQQYPPEKLEMIVVDDRSEDRSWEILEKAKESDARLKPLRITDLLPGFAPKKRALDMGIRAASGDIILLTDADCTPPPGWAKSMVDRYQGETNVVLGYSPYRYDRPAASLLKGMLSLDYFSLAAVAAASTGWNRPLTATGTNLSYRRDAFLRANGFEAIKQYVSGDDDLFVHRAAEERWGKFSFALVPESFVPAAAPRTLRQFMNQRARYASKGRDYEMKVTAGLVAVYLLNVSLTVGIVGALAGTAGWVLPVAVVWGVKSLFEFSFLSRVASTFGEQRLLRYYLPAALVHPFYVTIFGCAGLLGRFQWKGGDFGKTIPTDQGKRS